MKLASKISPCLWFDGQAEEAAEFYVSVFENSRITEIARYPEAGQEIHGRPAGSVMTVDFELDGQSFIALNGGPEFTFNEALSLSIDCENQAEVDRYWDRLATDGGQPIQCGWVKDKFGVSWQVIPRRLPELMADSDRARAARVMEAMLQMIKIDVAQLEAAAEG